MTYLLLFWEFFKIGLFGIGGGLAALPFLFDLANTYDWFTSAELVDMIAVAESTPGPIAINMATYAGYHAAGISGAAIATLGLMVPPVIVSILICKILAHWKENKYVLAAFSGLRPGVAGLLAAIALSLIAMAVCGTTDIFQISSINIKALIFFVLLTPAVFYFKKQVIVFIVIGAAVGIIFQF